MTYLTALVIVSETNRWGGIFWSLFGFALSVFHAVDDSYVDRSDAALFSGRGLYGAQRSSEIGEITEAVEA